MALWADAKPSPEGEIEERRRRRATVAAVSLMLAAFAVYSFGLFARHLAAVAIGFGALAVLLPLLLAITSYRPAAGEESTRTGRIFHISRARWSIGDLVTLHAHRSRRRQFIRNKRWLPTPARMIYFFPERPTHKAAKEQRLRGRRSHERYLYELAPMTPIRRIHRRGAAMATREDFCVKVIARQPITPGSIHARTSDRDTVAKA